MERGEATILRHAIGHPDWQGTGRCAMTQAIKKVLLWLGQPHLVEFDYRDTAGLHHGQCYVRYLFGGQQRIKRLMSSFGYTNIHIV
jgi:hypothetical protein